MKNLKAIVFISIFSFSSLSQLQAEGNAQQVIYVKNTPVTAPLMSKWIEAYTSLHPEVTIHLAEKNAEHIDLDFTIMSVKENPTASGKAGVDVGRLALLPVTSGESPFLDQLSKKKLNKKEIRNLFFFDDLSFDDAGKKKKSITDELTVYTSNLPVSGAAILAAHFGYEQTDIRGKKISGDDIYLLQALKKDPTGITFNSLSYLYDIRTRQLKKELALLPLDVKKEHAEVLNEGNVDRIIELLEKTSIDLVPTQPVTLVYRNNDTQQITDFIIWILTDGQKYNHDFGFLKINDELVNRQRKQIEQLHYTAEQTDRSKK